MLKGFKEFIMQGNVIDLAVAVVIGTAFASIVDAFTSAIINPTKITRARSPAFSRIACQTPSAVSCRPSQSRTEGKTVIVIVSSVIAMTLAIT